MDGGELWPPWENHSRQWQFVSGFLSTPTTKCFLPSGSEMALEKKNVLLPPDVLHAIVSLC